MRAEIKSKHRDTSFAKKTSLGAALGFFLFAYILTVARMLYEYTGVLFSPAFFRHPEAIMEILAGALGLFVFPAVHVAIASISNTKRTSTSRRNIFIGWSTAISIISGIHFIVLLSQH